MSKFILLLVLSLLFIFPPKAYAAPETDSGGVVAGIRQQIAEYLDLNALERLSNNNDLNQLQDDTFVRQKTDEINDFLKDTLYEEMAAKITQVELVFNSISEIDDCPPG